MKWFILIHGLVGILLAPLSHAEETECRWDNTRDGVQFGSISDRHNLTNVYDCANALGDYMLKGEPIRGATMFDGVVVLQNSSGQLLGHCITKTVRPISEDERSNIPFFITVNNEVELADWKAKYPGILNVFTIEKSVQILRSKEWQDHFRQYFTVTCDFPNS